MGTVRIDTFRPIVAKASAGRYMESIAERAERIADEAEEMRVRAVRHARATRQVTRGSGVAK